MQLEAMLGDKRTKHINKQPGVALRLKQSHTHARFCCRKKMRDELRILAGAALRAGCAMAGAKVLSPLHC
jgi:hypothetical protein